MFEEPELLLEESTRPKVDIKPLQVKGGPIVLDRDRLMRACVDGDISKKAYIKFALEVEYGAKASFIDFDCQVFADEFSGETENSKGEPKILSINAWDVHAAIAAMGKKGQIETDVQLQLTLNF